MNNPRPSGLPHRPSTAKAQRLPSVEARQGVTLGHIRYVLGISVALAVVALAVIYFSYF
jgi:hypothetical protein